MAINKFTGTTNSVWGTSTNWSQGTVPTASDGHVTTFDASSPACDASASNKAVNSIDFTGYTNTITLTTRTITSSGAVTLSATMTFSVTTGGIAVATTATLTSNGKTLNGILTFTGGSTTITFADNWTVTGLVTTPGSAIVFNGSTLNAGNGVTMGNTAGNITGTTTLNVTGGTVTGSVSTGTIRLNMNFTGNVTISATQVFRYDTGTLTYVSGVITTAGSTFIITATTVTLNTNGVTWNNVTLAGASTQTITLSSTLRATTLTMPSVNVVFAGAGAWDINNLVGNGSGGVSRTLVAAQTYRVRSSFATGGSKLLVTSWLSSIAGTRAILTVDSGATQEVAYVTATDIDGSAGQAISNYQGTQSNSLNWSTFPTRRTTAARSMVS